MTSGSDLEGQGSVCCCNILTTPLIISPQEPWDDRNPEAFCGFLRLCRLFFAFFGSSATCFKNDIEKTPKKVGKSMILASQLPPKTVPKSIQKRCPKKHAIFINVCSICFVFSIIDFLKACISLRENHYFQGFRKNHAFAIFMHFGLKKPTQNPSKTRPGR